jgi:hypothetical protein
MAQSGAARIVRRELAAIADKGAKHASNPTAWAEWLDEFYAAHQKLVAETLQLPPLVTRGYAERHRDALRAGGLSAAEGWGTRAIDELVALVVP